jgi:hypothetical protein
MESVLTPTDQRPIEVGQTVRTLEGGHTMTVVAIDCCGRELIATCIRRTRGRKIRDFYSVDDLEPMPASSMQTLDVMKA